MAILQVIVSGITLFLLYRYLLRTIGSEEVGVWAVILATAAASRISELGFTGSAVKYTAKYLGRGEQDKASEVIQTTAVTIGVLLAGVLVACYPLFAWMMTRIIPPEHIASAQEILPYALASVWIGAVAGVFLSGLDGCQRIDLRVAVSVFASVLFLGLTWLCVPEHGLVGLACAQIGQGLVMLSASWVLLRRMLPPLPFLPTTWNYTLFREMFRYGFNFQIISIIAMLFDPITKALMAKFGGLSASAYYEMASRMVIQFRSLLTSANQVIVPRVADCQESAPDKISDLYLDSYRMIFFFALPLYVGVAAITPLASELWVGHFDESFVGYSLLLVAGYSINTLIGPAYFVNQGTGLLRGNVWSHLAIGILNLALGYLLGLRLGGAGVVLGYVLSLVAGSGLLVYAFHRDYRVPLAELLPVESRRLFLVCCLGLLIGWGAFCFLEDRLPPLLRAGLALVVCITPATVVFWMHPLRARISSKIFMALGRRAEVGKS